MSKIMTLKTRKNQRFVYIYGLVPGSRQGGWWWIQSQANQSPQFSLFNREFTGKFDKFKPFSEFSTAETYSQPHFAGNFPGPFNRELN